MAENGNARGGLGWVILVVALAVPGVLFFNWWSHLKADREKTVAAKARGRVPDGGVFQSSPNAKLINPMTPAVSTGATTAAEPAAAPANPVPAPKGASHEAQAQTIAALPAGAPAAPAGEAAAPMPAISSATSIVPPLKRDPTLSPLDQVRISEEEEAKRKAAEDIANIKHPKPSKKGSASDPKKLVDLQGIISNPESGFKAIVNNEVIGAGEFIGNTRIKVVKINDLGVTFEYQGKRFSKGVSRD